MFYPGDSIQGFTIIRQLGKGGMGEVYLGEDAHLARKVAIKELSSALGSDESFTQRFKHEAQLQARLSHPNIVSLYSFFEEGGRYYMVLEYAEGITLRDLIRQTGPVPYQRATTIIRQVLEALEYAHRQKIIHRDIKPVNIIVGANDQVKILDFGISKIMGERGLTGTGQMLGTVNYMSPEQVKAIKDIDGRSDIYSLGVTFFEVLSGRLPYDTQTDSDYEIMNQIVQAPMPDPRSYYPGIPEKTVAILFKMLAKDRNQRYGSAWEVMQDFEAPVVSMPVPAEAPTRMVDPQPRPQVEVPANTWTPVNVKNYMAQAILVTLFCFIPTGIPAIVNASRVNGLITSGRVDEAMEASKKAHNWIISSLVINLSFWVFGIIMSIITQ